MRLLAILAALFLHAAVRADGNPDHAKVRDTVWAATWAIEQKNWKDAGWCFAKDATVTVIPVEEPAKRTTQTAAAFLEAKSRWAFKVLDYHIATHGDTGTLLLDSRSDDRLCRSTFELVKTDGQWKIESARIAYRPDAKGAAEEMKALKGEWDYQRAERDGALALIRSLNLKLEPDEYRIEGAFAGFNLFGGGTPPDKYLSVRAWNLRVDPTASPKTFEIEWRDDEKTYRYHGVYKLHGDELRMNIAEASEPRPKVVEDVEKGISPLVFKRKK